MTVKTSCGNYNLLKSLQKTGSAYLALIDTNNLPTNSVSMYNDRFAKKGKNNVEDDLACKEYRSTCIQP